MQALHYQHPTNRQRTFLYRTLISSSVAVWCSCSTSKGFRLMKAYCGCRIRAAKRTTHTREREASSQAEYSPRERDFRESDQESSRGPATRSSAQKAKTTTGGRANTAHVCTPTEHDPCQHRSCVQTHKTLSMPTPLMCAHPQSMIHDNTPLHVCTPTDLLLGRAPLPIVLLARYNLGHVGVARGGNCLNLSTPHSAQHHASSHASMHEDR